MKCSNRILSSATAFLVACSLGTATATADVFHGHWIGGRIEETYQRLGGWPTFGDALTPKVCRRGMVVFRSLPATPLFIGTPTSMAEPPTKLEGQSGTNGRSGGGNGSISVIPPQMNFPRGSQEGDSITSKEARSIGARPPARTISKARLKSDGV